PSVAENMRNGNSGGSGGFKKIGRSSDYDKRSYHNHACGSCCG
ncbi:9169_t:CDS:2, partial [Scutellospora calospora]